MKLALIGMTSAAFVAALLSGCVTNDIDSAVGEVRDSRLAQGGIDILQDHVAKSDNSTVKAAGGFLSFFGFGAKPSAPAPYHPAGAVLMPFEKLPDGSYVPYSPPTNRIETWAFPRPYKVSESPPQGSAPSASPIPSLPGTSGQLAPPAGSLLNGPTTGGTEL